MKVTYSTNWMGPISKRFFEEHGTGWSGGRIDIRGDEEFAEQNPYGDEIGLPIMKSWDWNRFSNWLNTVKTEDVKTLDELLSMYYAEGYPEIKWWRRR